MVLIKLTRTSVCDDLLKIIRNHQPYRMSYRFSSTHFGYWAELQAEGVAYVVTRHFGMENKSFNDLALYHANYKEIMENMKGTSLAAKDIIDWLERLDS